MFGGNSQSGCVCFEKIKVMHRPLQESRRAKSSSDISNDNIPHLCVTIPFIKDARSTKRNDWLIFLMWWDAALVSIDHDAPR